MAEESRCRRENAYPGLFTDSAKAGDLYTKTGTVKIDNKLYPAEVGYILVLEDPADVHSRLIALPVKRILADQQPCHEPIFYLGGGPGQSNMGYKPHSDYFQNHDYVLVGYRGVDGSVVLGSTEIKKGIEGKGQ
jgi:hypothetical protein